MSELIIPMGTKTLLSGVLVLLAIVFLVQAWRMWFDRSLVLAPFDFLEAGSPSPQSGEQFARMVRTDLVQLAGLYNVGEVANASAVPSSSQRDPAVPMKIPAEFDVSFLETIELKAYGIEFGSIFKALRRRLESPSEITGSITHQGDKYTVFVELNQPVAGAEAQQRWSIQYAKDLPDATRNVACRVFRSLAATAHRQSPDAALFRTIDDEAFCLFNHALATYDQYRTRKAHLSDADATTLLTEAAKSIASLLEREPVTFPYVHKLAALVFYEQKKYIEAERVVGRYIDWLTAERREDQPAQTLQTNIRSRKLQTTPAVSRLRPLQAGSSVGSFAEQGAGMICCIVQDAKGDRFLISVAQVLRSTDKAIVQPAVRDGGTKDDLVAELETITETIAIARVHDSVSTDPRVLLLGAITGFESRPKDNQDVVTVGFDGRRKEGKVISTGNSIDVTTDKETGAKVRVENVTITSDISSGGEIGAPVLTPGGKLVGMIFAAGGPTTLVLPLESELSKRGLKLSK